MQSYLYCFREYVREVFSESTMQKRMEVHYVNFIPLANTNYSWVFWTVEFKGRFEKSLLYNVNAVYNW